MKKIRVMAIAVWLILGLGSPALAVRFSFDLTMGKVNFSYSTIGAYNPVRLTLDGSTGVVRTWVETQAYESQAALEALGKFILSQLASVTGMEISSELQGKLGWVATCPSGQFSLSFKGDGTLQVRFNLESADVDPEETEIHTKVYVDAESGQLVIQDSRPEPLPGEVLGQKLGMPKDLASDIVEEFGRARVEAALENALSHNGTAYAQGSSIAGGAASVMSDGSVGINELSQRAIFDLSLRGVEYQGYLRDSTLYMRLLHPANGVSIRDMRVILTVVELNPPEPLHGPHIVLWDAFPYDYQAGCYLYRLNSTGWRPGSYEVYIDVGQILNFKLPITITDWHQVVARRG